MPGNEKLICWLQECQKLEQSPRRKYKCLLVEDTRAVETAGQEQLKQKGPECLSLELGVATVRRDCEWMNVTEYLWVYLECHDVDF